MQKSLPQLADPLLPSQRRNGAAERTEETTFASSVSAWLAELMKLIPDVTRKSVRKTVRKAVRKHGPEIATAIVTGVVTSLLTATAAPKKKKKKKKKH